MRRTSDREWSVEEPGSDNASLPLELKTVVVDKGKAVVGTGVLNRALFVSPNKARLSSFPRSSAWLLTLPLS